MELFKRLFWLRCLPILVHLCLTDLPKFGFLSMKIYGKALDNLLCKYQETFLHCFRVDSTRIVKTFDSESFNLFLFWFN